MSLDTLVEKRVRELESIRPQGISSTISQTQKPGGAYSPGSVAPAPNEQTGVRAICTKSSR
ncbi:hypothetical protein BJX64DRAFT_267265 [Aspergillus heterothallicus]